MIVGTVKMNARQFLVIGEDPPGVRLELVGGEVAVSPRPSLDHSYVLLALSRLLGQYVEDHDLGQLFTDVDIVLDEHDVRSPDLLFIKKSRLRLLKPKVVDVPPDLCVEIVSPGSVQIDRDDKFNQYQLAGINHYWIIDPATRTAEAYHLKRKRYALAARGSGADAVRFPPFDGLETNLGRLWRPRK